MYIISSTSVLHCTLLFFSYCAFHDLHSVIFSSNAPFYHANFLHVVLWYVQRQRYVVPEAINKSLLPQDFIEKQRAYFAEVDAFDLPEEAVSESELE